MKLLHLITQKRFIHNESMLNLQKKYKLLLNKNNILQKDLKDIKNINIKLSHELNIIKDKNAILINTNKQLNLELSETKKILNFNYFNIFRKL